MTVVVGTDGRAQSDGALRACALFEESMGPWRVVSAAPVVYDFTPGLDLGLTAEASHVLLEEQRRAVEAQVRRVLGPTAAVDIDVRTGDPAQLLAAVAEKHDASLVVSGLGRHRIVERLLSDETALAIVRASDKPVLAVPEDFAAVPDSAVVGIDFSDASLHAAQLAVTFLASTATIYLVNVAPREDVLSMLTGGFAAYEERARAALESVAAHLAISPRMHVQPHVREGDPGSQLLHYADELDAGLISVGTRGRGFVKRLLLGSVATKVIRASPIPVLTVPATDEAHDAASDR